MLSNNPVQYIMNDPVSSNYKSYSFNLLCVGPVYTTAFHSGFYSILILIICLLSLRPMFEIRAFAESWHTEMSYNTNF